MPIPKLWRSLRIHPRREGCSLRSQGLAGPHSDNLPWSKNAEAVALHAQLNTMQGMLFSAQHLTCYADNTIILLHPRGEENWAVVSQIQADSAVQAL